MYSAGKMWLFLHELLRSVVVRCLLQAPGAIGDAAGHPNKYPWSLLSSDPLAEQPAQKSPLGIPNGTKRAATPHILCLTLPGPGLKRAIIASATTVCF